MNPEISAEERKRLRVLKNRESAMRSLAKKAEYSAQLENKEKEAVASYKLKRDCLEKLLATAISLRTALSKVPEEVPKLLMHTEACINRATTVLAEDEAVQPNPSQQDSQGPASDAAVNGEEADVK